MESGNVRNLTKVIVNYLDAPESYFMDAKDAAALQSRIHDVNVTAFGFDEFELVRYDRYSCYGYRIIALRSGNGDLLMRNIGFVDLGEIAELSE